MIICEYGCGQEAKYQLKNGKWCCSKSWNSCSCLRSKNSKSNLGKICHTDESKKKISLANIGHIPWNKNRTNVYSLETKNKMSCAHKNKKFSKIHKIRISIANSNISENTRNKMKKSHLLTINDIKEKYPLFAKVEEMRYEPGKEKDSIIQVHCKNHNCPNSKEKGGWFTPTKSQLYERRRQIKNDIGGCYFYCSDKCKEECPLYDKRVSQLIKEDLIAAGHIEDPWYTSGEYLIWRAKILELDNYICQFCGKPATIVHHINPQKVHPEQALDSENGLSSCEECHYKYGHRDRWCTTGYLSQLVCERIVRIKEKLI